MALHLTNAQIIDCVGDDLRPVVGTVVIEGGLIGTVEPGPSRAPADGWTIDLRGAYLLPGLWDVHCHPGGMIPDPHRVSLFESEAERTLRAARNTMAALRAGVVALRAVGDAGFVDIALRETYANRLPSGLWRKGYADKPLVGPRMFCAGPAIRTTGGHASNGRVEGVFVRPHMDVDGAEEVRKAARHCIKMGADWIKLAITGGIAGIRENMYEIQMTREEIQAACEVAHNKGLKVCAHTGSAEAVKLAVRVGVDCIEHGYQLDEEACALMAEKGVYYCPTLGVTHDEAYMRRWEWPEHSIRRALDGAALHRRSFQAALREGVQIVNGADRNPIADTAVDELEWHVRAGASCAHTLLGSTRRAADLCGVAATSGTIAAGKVADIIAVGRNPLDDISALRDVWLVIKDGEVVVDHLAETPASASGFRGAPSVRRAPRPTLERCDERRSQAARTSGGTRRSRRSP
jgi:imidazolonepropionase-like amidohydrolase